MWILQYVKAVAAAVGALAGEAILVAVDDNITFDEIGYVYSLVLAAIAAVTTFAAPKNQER